MQTSDRIIEAATRLIKKNGYRGVSTKAIATEAKVNESTIFGNLEVSKGYWKPSLKDIRIFRNLRSC